MNALGGKFLQSKIECEAGESSECLGCWKPRLESDSDALDVTTDNPKPLS